MGEEIKITEIVIIPLKPKENGLVALASCVFNNQLYLGSMGIFTRLDGGYRITYPNKKEDRINIFHPINDIVGKRIEQAIIEKYEQLMSGKNY